MPYGVDKQQGGDSPENVSFMEKCVKGIGGTNKRTGKPYSEGEKIAICKTALKNKKSKSASVEYINEEELAAEKDKVEQAMEICHQRMMKTGKAKNMDEAHQLCQKALAKSSYELYRLEFILDTEFILRKE